MQESNKKITHYGANIDNGIIKSITEQYLNNTPSQTVNTDDIYSDTQNLGYSFSNRDNIEAWSRNLKRRVKSSFNTSNILEQIVNEIKEHEERALMENVKTEINNKNLKPTANPEFMKDDNNNYYRFNKNEFILENSVINIDEKGDYTVKTDMGSNNEFLEVTYDLSHKPIKFKVINSKNKSYCSAKYVAKRLNMKQELVKQHKLHGYCGRSSGFWAVIKNMISKPKPSGYYFDKSYNFFRWNAKYGQFEIQRRTGKTPGAPMIADYEFKKDVVIRTDYDGVGIFY